jgi:uncharacterized protein
MKDIKKLAMGMASLSVYRGILNRPVPRALCRLLQAANRAKDEFLEAWGAFFRRCANRLEAEICAVA